MTTFETSLPTDAVLFSPLTGCPTGWELASVLSGRVLVALPAGGQGGASFGGASISPNATVAAGARALPPSCCCCCSSSSFTGAQRYTPFLPPCPPPPPGTVHELGGVLTLPDDDIGLAEGCCGDGYAHAGAQAFTGVTQFAEAGFPYAMVSACVQSSSSAASHKIAAPKL